MSLASLTRAFADTLHALGQELKCPICLSLMSGPRILACGHTFCGTCLSGWLKTKACCPICKTAAARRGDRKEETVTALLQAFRLATPPSSQGAGLNIPSADASTSHFDEACAFTQLPGATQLFDGFKDWEGDQEDAVGDEPNEPNDEDDIVVLAPQEAHVAVKAPLPVLSSPALSSPPPNPSDAIMAAAPAPEATRPSDSSAGMDIPASIMETACCVCLSLRVKPGDAIIKCVGKPKGAGGPTGCGMTVHLSCYGSTAEATPWEDWLCDSCRGCAAQDSLNCDLCPCSARHALKPQAKEVCVNGVPGRTPPPSRARGGRPSGSHTPSDNMHVDKTGVLVTDEVPGGGFTGLNPGLPFTDVSLSRARRAGDMDFPQAWRPTLAGTWVHAICCIWLPEPFTVPAADIIKTLQQTLNVFGSAEGGSTSGRKRRREEGEEDITNDPIELKPMPLRADHLDSSSIMSQVPVSLLHAYAASAGLPLPSSPFPFAISLPLLALAVAYFRSSKFLPSTLIVTNLSAIDRDRYRLYCVVCGLRGGEVGAVVQCCKDECVRGYHPMCALRAGLFMKWSQVVDEAEIHRNEADGMLDVSYTHFCDQHSPSAFDARIGKTAAAKGQRKHGSTSNLRAVKFASVAVVEADDPCPPLPSPPTTSHFPALDIVPVTAAPTPASTSSAPPKKKARLSSGKSPAASSAVSRLTVTPTSAHKSPANQPGHAPARSVAPLPSCSTIVDCVDCGKAEIKACLDAGNEVVDLAFCPTALDAAIAARVALLQDPSSSARAPFPTHVVTPASTLAVPWEELVEQTFTSTRVAWRQHDDAMAVDDTDAVMAVSGVASALLPLSFGSPAGKRSGEDLTLPLPLARRCSHRYLCALLAGCHLVRPEWITACTKGGYPVHELPYALVGHKGEAGIRPHMFFGPSPLMTLGHILDGAPLNAVVGQSGAGSSPAAAGNGSLSKETQARRRQTLVTSVCASAAPARALRMRRLADASSGVGSGQGRLFRSVTFVLWGEFENPPKLVTRMEMLELAAIGGAACVWPMPPSGRTLDLHHVDEYGEWEPLVNHALAHAPASGFPPLVVVCDEPHFSLPACISSLAPGSVAMVTPAFLLHCAATACLLDPFQDDYAHPAAKGILKAAVPNA